MLNALLSGDYPRSRILTGVLLAILVGLAFAPFLFSGAAAINTAAKICIFIVLVASYDLLLGYTGIVSFAHTMFFGIGGYGVGLGLYTFGAGWRCHRARHPAGARRRRRARLPDRAPVTPRAGDLLRHDHARRGLGLRSSSPRSSPRSPAARTAAPSPCRPS